ncbi:hypothetical protein, partial [Escherichia coli]|uniref:hypothetical protein n=1 Tax=Escherichia coli TaxID=562 RepID=UPI003CE4C72E
LLRDGQGFLSPAAMAMLRTPLWSYDGTNGDTEGGFFCSYGLAVQFLGSAAPGCRDQPFADKRPRFGHAGEAYGLKSGLWVDPAAAT